MKKPCQIFFFNNLFLHKTVEHLNNTFFFTKKQYKIVHFLYNYDTNSNNSSFIIQYWRGVFVKYRKFLRF